MNRCCRTYSRARHARHWHVGLGRGRCSWNLRKRRDWRFRARDTYHRRPERYRSRCQLAGWRLRWQVAVGSFDYASRRRGRKRRWRKVSAKHGRRRILGCDIRERERLSVQWLVFFDGARCGCRARWTRHGHAGERGNRGGWRCGWIHRYDGSTSEGRRSLVRHRHGRWQRPWTRSQGRRDGTRRRDLRRYVSEGVGPARPLSHRDDAAAHRATCAQPLARDFRGIHPKHGPAIRTRYVH